MPLYDFAHLTTVTPVGGLLSAGGPPQPANPVTIAVETATTENIL